jgi:ankyrin repeat protein
MIPFIQSSGQPGLCNSNGSTLLHAAAEGWQPEMAEFLILSGADVNAQNKHGDTPLHALVRSREIPVDGTFFRGRPPEKMRRETFRMLLRRRADISIGNTDGANALHLAASEGDLMGIEELSRHGGQLLLADKTSKGATALD